MPKYSSSLYWISKRLSTIFSFILIFSIFIAFSNSSDESIKKTVGKIESKNPGAPKEKIYIHFDKSYYNVGEDIWFKAYLVNADTHRPEAISQIIYVDLINPLNKIIDTKIIKTEDGFGEGDFKLKNDLIEGVYTVRAYTNYMRNFDGGYLFRKKIFVNSLGTTIKVKENQFSSLKKVTDRNPLDMPPESKPDLQFFPEGGSMVNGILSRIGFKAIQENGKGIDLKGEIVDENNDKITEFESSRLGMGKFSLIPESDKVYRANIIYKGSRFSYGLPPVLNKGVTLQIVNYNEYYQANIRSSLLNGIDNYKVVGRQRNGIIFSSQIVGNKSKALVKIPKDILLNGITQFTLLDGNDKPLAERLVFFESNKSMPSVHISPSKGNYGKRELVELEISLNTISQQKSKTNMSMAVADISVTQPDNYNLDIKTHLLLNSEIKGEIEQPGYYFNSKDPKRKENLNLLMMTQGWREYVLDNPNSLHESNPKFEHETGIKIKGKVKSYFNSNKSVIAEVTLSYKNMEAIGYDKMMTDDHGSFIFSNLDFNDSTHVLLQASEFNKKKGLKKTASSKGFLIELDSITPPEITFQKSFTNQSGSDLSKEFATEVNKISNIDLLQMNQENLIKLDEVEITGQVKEAKKRYEKRRLLYKEPSYSIDFNDLQTIPTGNALTALKGRVPGIGGGQIILRGANTLTGNTEPLYLLDGMPVDTNAITSIPVLDIDFVDVIVGPRAAIYGSRAGNGVIAIYTRQVGNKINNYDQKRVPRSTSFIHPGFYRTRRFYTPVYKSINSSENRPDYRSTIYWNPKINMEGQGKTKVSFYTTDAATTYKVILEGITSGGVPIMSELFIEVD